MEALKQCGTRDDVDLRTASITKEARIASALRGYIRARRDLLLLAKEFPQDLGGNDNLVGRIGEYIGIKFLGARFGEKARCKSQKGHDLICVDGKRISVKCITAENEKGRTSRITDPWDELIVIVLDDSYEGSQIGHLTRDQFEQALADGTKRASAPHAHRKMLRDTGLIGRYGTVVRDFRWCL